MGYLTLNNIVETTATLGPSATKKASSVSTLVRLAGVALGVAMLTASAYSPSANAGDTARDAFKYMGAAIVADGLHSAMTGKPMTAQNVIRDVGIGTAASGAQHGKGGAVLAGAGAIMVGTQTNGIGPNGMPPGGQPGFGGGQVMGGSSPVYSHGAQQNPQQFVMNAIGQERAACGAYVQSVNALQIAMSNGFNTSAYAQRKNADKEQCVRALLTTDTVIIDAQNRGVDPNFLVQQLSDRGRFLTQQHELRSEYESRRATAPSYAAAY